MEKLLQTLTEFPLKKIALLMTLLWHTMIKLGTIKKTGKQETADRILYSYFSGYISHIYLKIILYLIVI